MVLHGFSPREGSLINIHFKIWTGHENISRQLKAKVLRSDLQGVAIGFLENDLVTFAVVQDIQHYQQYERRKENRTPEPTKLYCAM